MLKYKINNIQANFLINSNITSFSEEFMREYIEKRALKIADYIIETGSTVRAAAEVFKISKSSVHKDVTERLREIHPQNGGL